MKRTILTTLTLLMTILTFACGGGGSSESSSSGGSGGFGPGNGGSGGGGSGGGGVTIVNTTMTIQDSDANNIAGATVYIPGTPPTGFTATVWGSTGNGGLLGLTDAQGKQCEDPAQQAAFAACTGNDGVVILPCQASSNPNIKVQKNGVDLDISANCSGGDEGAKALGDQPDLLMVYVANHVLNKVHTLFMNKDTGVITDSGEWTDTGVQPWDFVGTPNGRFLYSMNINDGQLDHFEVSGFDGHVTYQGSIQSGNSPLDILVDPTGACLYNTNYTDSTISRFSINPTTGALTELLPRMTTGSTLPLAIEFNPAGDKVYVAVQGNDTIERYSFTAGTCALGFEASVAVGGFSGIRDLVFRPDGAFLYASNEAENQLIHYSVDGAGNLTEQARLVTGQNPYKLAMDPLGTYLYMTNFDQLNIGTGGEISQYSITAGTGALTELLPRQAIVNPMGIDIDPTGNYVFVAGLGAGAPTFSTSFAIQGDGRLAANQTPIIGGTASCVFYDPNP